MNLFIIVGSVSGSKGGVSAYLSEFIPSLAAHDSIKLSIIRKTLSGVENIKFNNVRDFSTRYDGLPSYIVHIWKILNIVLKNRDGLFYVHGVWNIECIFTLFFCILTKRRLLLSPHGMLMSYPLGIKSARKMFFIRLLKFFDLRSIELIVNSAIELKQTDLLKLKFRKKHIVPHFIDLNVVRDNLGVRKIDSNKECIRFISISRVDNIKGFDVTLIALSKLNPAYDFIYDIYGPVDPGYKSYLISLIAGLGLESKVNLYPPVWGVSKLHKFRDAHYSIAYSYTENFGMSVLESLSVGTPVVVSENSPWSDLCDRSAGFVVSDVNEYFAVLEKACESALSITYSVSRENALSYSKRFDKNEIMQLYYNIFMELSNNE